MAKRIRVSDDAGANYFTLPGNTGELSNESGQLDDTIFGQDFSSTQTGINGWTINANGLFKGFAGYQAKIMKTGSTTSFTAEAVTSLGGHKYQITNVAKRALDRNVAVVTKDGATDISATQVQSIDYLNGIVTLKSAYTVLGTITLGGSYLPLSVVGCANDYTLTQNANSNDNTCMDTAQQNDGNRTFEYGLKTVSLQLNGIYKAANGFLALLQSRAEVIIEIDPKGDGKVVARGFFKPVTTGQSGDVGNLETETITFNLSVPDIDTLPYPFHWYIASDATLNVSIQKCIASWENKTLILVQYLPDGSIGVEGDCVITDLSLAGGLESMAEFTVNFQGSDELVAFP